MYIRAQSSSQLSPLLALQSQNRILPSSILDQPSVSQHKQAAMAPPSADTDIETSSSPPLSPSIQQKPRTVIPEFKKSTLGGITQSSAFPAPLVYSGTLDNYESFDITSVIGREFPKLQLSDILSDDEKVRDLAILGEFFFFFLACLYPCT